MLSPIQITRVLKHCEKVNKKYIDMNLAGDEGTLYFDFMRNQGWCEALRLVLEADTKSINNKELEDE